MLQNLLNSSSHAAAIQRAQQLNNYVQAQTQQVQQPQVNKQVSSNIQKNSQINNNPIDMPELNTFEDVLNSSLNVHTRFNTNKPKYDIKFGA